MKKVEIDYFEDNEHIQEKDGHLEVQLTTFPEGFVGNIEQEFVEKDNKPGKFEEFIFKEIEEE